MHLKRAKIGKYAAENVLQKCKISEQAVEIFLDTCPTTSLPLLITTVYRFPLSFACKYFPHTGSPNGAKNLKSSGARCYFMCLHYNLNPLIAKLIIVMCYATKLKLC